MLYSYFFNMLKVGVPGFTRLPQLLVYNLLFFKNVQAKSALDGALFLYRTVSFPHSQNFAIAASISAAQAAAMPSSPGWRG